MLGYILIILLVIIAWVVIGVGFVALVCKVEKDTFSEDVLKTGMVLGPFVIPLWAIATIAMKSEGLTEKVANYIDSKINGE